jgi:pilus assembly protein Flp/PilA
MNNALLKLYVKFQGLGIGEEGQDLVEYSLLLTIVALSLISGMNGIATAVTRVFTNVSNSLA